MKTYRGFTLIESIVAMVVIGLAMVMLVTILYPQVERSAAPHYQTRATALGQSMMSQILARGFDHNSDLDGGTVRCGEPDDGSNDCTTTMGTDGSESSPEDFNDVDDYLGCWQGSNSSDCEGVTPVYSLENILGSDVSSQYQNFTVLVDVFYVDDDFEQSSSVTSLKKVHLTVKAGKWGDYEYTAYRGNY
ncbi:type IV pilus modification PilV family protein [Vibrio paucivorans]